MAWRSDWKGRNPIVARSIPHKPVKIAIVLHVFYEDYVDRFCYYISRLGFPVDVFVTTTSSRIAQVSESQLSRIQNVMNVKVVVVPNRGRNFAPLLVEFGKELLKYDVFGHFHSKKSLFTGSEQTLWADYLFDTLLDPARCKYHISLLADQASNVGLIYPTTPPSVSFMGNHWLQNVAAGKVLEKITGQKVSQFGFITYPIGGMFWARSSALATLLGADWSYDQFPMEEGQIDGTLQHGVERFVSVACVESGFKKVAFHPELNASFEDDSYVYAEYLDSLYGIHSGYLTEVECLSIDLFDSLISRVNSFDDYQKVKASEILGFTDPRAYLEIRKSAEIELRKSLTHRDVSITQIAELMSQKILDLESTELSPAEIVKAEVNCELEIVRVKSTLARFVKERQLSRKYTTIVIDTSYEREHIERILTQVGISIEYLNLQISSETGLRKDDSSYWASLAETLRFSRESFLHVGDNIVSDIQVPAYYGFDAMYLPNARDLAWMLGRHIPNEFAVVTDEFIQNQLNLYQDPVFPTEGIPKIGNRSRIKSS
jgi:hypothetical protein